MIAPQSFVRLTKLSTQNAGVLPDAYWLEGFIVEEPVLHHTLRVLRTARARQRADEPDRVEVAGLYASSPVQEILPREDGSVACRTLNSVWEVRAMPVPETVFHPLHEAATHLCEPS